MDAHFQNDPDILKVLPWGRIIYRAPKIDPWELTKTEVLQYFAATKIPGGSAQNLNTNQLGRIAHLIHIGQTEAVDDWKCFDQNRKILPDSERYYRFSLVDKITADISKKDSDLIHDLRIEYDINLKELMKLESDAIRDLETKRQENAAKRKNILNIGKAQ